jgi:hypothetical protein
MPQLAQVQAAADAFVQSTWWTTLTTRQGNYFASHGRFFQGLSTHAVLPAHTNGRDDSKPPDRLTTRPTDQTETWMDQLPEWASTTMPASVRINVYDGPFGHGWTVTLELTHSGVIWRRTVNVGPETHHAQPWQQGAV